MRVLILAVLASFVPAAWAVETPPPRDRRADEMREMREALVALGAVIDAASRPARGTEDVPRLLQDSLRRGTVDADAMGAILRFVLQEKEEKVAAAFADALTAVEPRLEGVDSERYGAAARSVLSVFAGVLRDAEANRRRDGDALLRELKPAIDAAAGALREAQEKAAGAAPPEHVPPAEEVPPGPAPPQD